MLLLVAETVVCAGKDVRLELNLCDLLLKVLELVLCQVKLVVSFGEALLVLFDLVALESQVTC